MTRVLWLCAGVGCLAASVFCFRGLAGEVYHQVGLEEAQQFPQSAKTARAFAIAGRLSPWMQEILVAQARNASARGELDSMLSLNRQALRWAPADVRLWTHHAQLLTYSGHMDTELDTALERTRQLGPAQFDVHLAKMLLGIQNWRFASESLREDTIRSSRFILKNDPAKFYRSLLLRRLDFMACFFLNAELELDTWCKLIAPARSRCDDPHLSSGAIQWCETQGLRS